MRYTDSTNRVVISDSGNWSGLVTASEVQEWLAKGNTIEPANNELTLTPEEKIVALEQANPITHRNLRELSLAVVQLIQLSTGTDPTQNKGIKKLMEVDAEIAELRKSLK